MDDLTAFQKIIDNEKGVCPSCGRCKECGQPKPVYPVYPRPTPVLPPPHIVPWNPYPWPRYSWIVCTTDRTGDANFMETGFPNLSRNT